MPGLPSEWPEIVGASESGPDATLRSAMLEATSDMAPPDAPPVVRWVPLPGPQTEAFSSPADVLFYGGAAGGGKELDVATPMPTPSGWTTMGALRTGDVVFGRDGCPVEVTTAWPVDLSPVSYRLTFDDGASILACADHRWLTFDASELAAVTKHDPEWRARRRAKRAPRSTGTKSAKFIEALRARNAAKPTASVPPPTGTIRTTAEIAATLRTAQGRTNHAIPVAAALRLPEAVLPLDPYLLGVWLGDGTTAQGSVSKPDPEIEAAFVAGGFTTRRYKNGITFGVRGLRVILRRAGVLGDKHIPPAYLRASRDQRLALLQGLMDTDGCACESGSVEFTSALRVLAEQTLELALSLGHKAAMKEGRATLKGRDCGPKYRIKWTPPETVFLLHRKAERQCVSTRRTTRFRYVVSCERVAPVPMRCISVDAPDGLYLAGRSFIPTHNTDLALGLALTAHRNSIIYRREYVQLRHIEERAREVIGMAGAYNGTEHLWRLADGRRVEFGGVEREHDVFKYQGRPHDFVAFDEAPQFTELQVRFLLGWLRTVVPGQRCRVVMAGNPPTGAEGQWVVKFFAPWLDPEHPRPAAPGELRWFVTGKDGDVEVEGPAQVEVDGKLCTPMSRSFIPARVEDNPALIAAGYRRVLEALPEPLRSQMLEGDFQAGGIDNPWQVIPTAWVQAAFERWRERRDRGDNPGPMTCLGLDVARGGKDKTVLARRHGTWFAPLLKHAGETTPNGPKVAALAVAALGQGAHVNIDVISIGSSPFDYLVDARIPVVAVNFSQRSLRSDGQPHTDRSRKLLMRNVRAYAYWAMREALDPETGLAFALPPDQELLADLTAARWEITATGVAIEDKDEIRKRIGRSPDCGDAVVLAYLPTLPPTVSIAVSGARSWGRESTDL